MTDPADVPGAPSSGGSLPSLLRAGAPPCSTCASSPIPSSRSHQGGAPSPAAIPQRDIERNPRAAAVVSADCGGAPGHVFEQPIESGAAGGRRSCPPAAPGPLDEHGDAAALPDPRRTPPPRSRRSSRRPLRLTIRRSARHVRRAGPGATSPRARAHRRRGQLRRRARFSNARARSSAVAKRSSGSLASARAMASSIARGRFARQGPGARRLDVEVLSHQLVGRVAARTAAAPSPPRTA